MNQNFIDTNSPEIKLLRLGFNVKTDKKLISFLFNKYLTGDSDTKYLLIKTWVNEIIKIKDNRIKFLVTDYFERSYFRILLGFLDVMGLADSCILTPNEFLYSIPNNVLIENLELLNNIINRPLPV